MADWLRSNELAALCTGILWKLSGADQLVQSTAGLGSHVQLAPPQEAAIFTSFRLALVVTLARYCVAGDDDARLIILHCAGKAPKPDSIAHELVRDFLHSRCLCPHKQRPPQALLTDEQQHQLAAYDDDFEYAPTSSSNPRSVAPQTIYVCDLLY